MTTLCNTEPSLHCTLPSPWFTVPDCDVLAQYLDPFVGLLYVVGLTLLYRYQRFSVSRLRQRLVRSLLWILS